MIDILGWQTDMAGGKTDFYRENISLHNCRLEFNGKLQEMIELLINNFFVKNNSTLKVIKLSTLHYKIVKIKTAKLSRSE